MDSPCLCGDPTCPRCFVIKEEKRPAKDYALALLDEYRDALRKYYGDGRCYHYTMTYRRGFYYIGSASGVRQSEIERRIDSLLKRTKGGQDA